MKKLIALLLLITLAFSAVSCAKQPENGDETDSTPIRIGYMQGPTGMGMAKLIHDNGGISGNEKYKFEKFGDVKEATAALLSGKIDMACLPTNNAAAIYNTQNEAVKVLAINCLNSLYIMTKTGTEIDVLEDLSGKTIYTIANGTPKAILEYVIDELDLNIHIETSATINGQEKTLTQPSDLASAMIAGTVDVALVPEPVATAAPLKIASQEKDFTYTVAFDMTDIWEQIAEYPVAMGCIVANRSFVEEHKTVTDSFLDEYKSSIEFMSKQENADTAAAYIVEATVLDAAPAAKKSLANLGDAISYIDGIEMKATLGDFYNAIDVSLIGGRLPDDDFYYEK